MQVSATIHMLHCTRSCDNLHLIYTMEKQANNYHKTKIRNTKFAAYRGAEKSLARPWKETSYSDQELTTLYQDLWHTNNRNIFLLFVHHKSWYSVVSLRHCNWFPTRVRLRTYQHSRKATLVLKWNIQSAQHTHLNRLKGNNLQQECVHTGVCTWHILWNIYRSEQQMEIWSGGGAILQEFLH